MQQKISKMELSKYAAKTSLEQSEAYTLCVKADALRLAGFYRESIPKYLRSVLLERVNIDAYYGLALSYKHLKTFQKAIDILQKSIAYCEDDFRIFYELGVCHLISGEPCPAIKCLIRAIELNPDNLNAQVQLALAHELVGEQELALMIYQRIIEVSPAFLKAYKHKAALLMSLDEYKDASFVFNDILKVNPKYSKALLGIGICFDKLKRTVDALRYYKRFLQYKPKSQQIPFVKSRISTLRNERTDDKRFALVSNPIAR